MEGERSDSGGRMVGRCAVEGGWSRRRGWEGEKVGQKVDMACVCVSRRGIEVAFKVDFGGVFEGKSNEEGGALVGDGG